jgi:hypothetical protein
MTSIYNVFLFYLIFEFLMLVFEFHVSLVISRTYEIYIEKNHKQFKKNQKGKTFTHSLLMSNNNEST